MAVAEMTHVVISGKDTNGWFGFGARRGRWKGSGKNRLDYCGAVGKSNVCASVKKSVTVDGDKDWNSTTDERTSRPDRCFAHDEMIKNEPDHIISSNALPL